MSSNIDDDNNVPTFEEVCYEMVASQEEIYLEETEEELRAILIFDDLSSSGGVGISMSAADNHPCKVEGPDEQLNHAAEELITGDSDDPPLSEEAVEEMLNNEEAPKGYPEKGSRSNDV